MTPSIRLAAGALLIIAAAARAGAAQAPGWPQASGPSGTWSAEAPDAPTRWSVARGEHIRWRTPLPNGGQGNLAVAAGRIFLATFPEYAGGPKEGNAILGHAVDQRTGRILWSVRLAGGRASPMMYAFSDSTSWTPICDGEHVWFFDSSGEMGCWDLDGKEVWRRAFRTQPERFPFNRQHEPFLAGDAIVTLEPIAPDEPGYRADRADWSFLRGIDKRTGRTLWIAEDGTTFYCTSAFGHLADGRPAVLHGRGGPHGVPETPIGLSLTSLAPGEAGKTIWRFAPEAVPGGPVDGTTFMALYTMQWDAHAAYWFRNAPEEAHLVIDAASGRLLRTQPLAAHADVRRWDQAQGRYVLQADVGIRELADPTYPLKAGEVMHVLPQWHANVVAAGYHYFLATTNNRRNEHAPAGHSGPAHCLGRVRIETGKVEYLELPVGVERKPGAPDAFIYGRSLRTRTEDAKGRDVAAEDRSRTDGWEIDAFFPTPVVLGGKVYISVALGLTYVIDARAAVLDEHALLAVNDLGPLGETWSMSSPSYSDGMLYHRSLKELVAIGPEDASGR